MSEEKTTIENTDHLSEEEVRSLKLKQLKQSDRTPYAYNFDKKNSTQEIINNFNSLETGESNETVIQLAGRIMAKRAHGKAFFGNIIDQSNNIQFYANLNTLGEEKFNFLLSLDTGDFIGFTGTPFKTRRGELTINISSFELLSKSLLPLPEKYHGLQDKELRYRHRYLDLIMNPESKKVFEIRSKTISSIRKFLEEKQFMEVETPVLHNIYGGAAARPFTTHHNTLDQDLFLRIALELHLKRLIVGGFEKVFEIGRVFRNEGISYKHNPEYTLLELYEAYSDYNDIMKLTEDLISTLIKNQFGSYKITYQETEIDFTPPFKRVSMTKELEEKYNIDSNNIELLKKKATELKLDVPKTAGKGHLILELYDKLIEPTLIQPTFIMDHPWETSPLAKKHRDNPDLVERFELIVNGMELANAFTELNDPEDQYDRFLDQIKAKEEGYEEAQEMDEDFVKALKHGMPPTGGLGIGIDRIVMLLSNSSSIRDVLLFPHMKNK
tara:strand:+ start:1957 stop:3447 length:1491 start_codon:yes stop_codon:yes gene_type:complete